MQKPYFYVCHIQLLNIKYFYVSCIQRKVHKVYLCIILHTTKNLQDLIFTCTACNQQFRETYFYVTRMKQRFTKTYFKGYSTYNQGLTKTYFYVTGFKVLRWLYTNKIYKGKTGAFLCQEFLKANEEDERKLYNTPPKI